MGVWPATSADCDAVMGLLREARDWQCSRGVPVWSEFDAARIGAEISSGVVYVARVQGLVHGTVTLVENDPLVWGDQAAALYLHRLASSRGGPRRGVGALLIRWARTVAVWRCKRWLRLETWLENGAMRAYYERQGFRLVENRFFPPDSALPADYRGTVKSLYEIEL
jgi:ribosomal protein S18 acetylase RimI-like enzyme